MAKRRGALSLLSAYPILTLRGHVMGHPSVPLFDALILLEHEVILFHENVCPVGRHLFSLAASHLGDGPIFRV
jgi:hypothetical protein